MQIQRYFSDETSGPYDGLTFRQQDVERDDGSFISVSAPSSWPVGAVSAFAEHALLRPAVPAARKRVREKSIPRELRRHTSLTSELSREQDVRSAIDRMAGTLARAGLAGGYFETSEEALVFFDELRALLIMRRATFSSALWQSVGWDWAYGAQQPSTTPPKALHLPVYDLGSAALEVHLAADIRRNQDATALAMGRSALSDLTKAIKNALLHGPATPEDNLNLKAALADADALGLPAAAAQRILEECVAGDESWPDADTHLDFDSDIWDAVGERPECIVRNTSLRDPSAEAACFTDLAMASFRGEAPKLVFAQDASDDRTPTNDTADISHQGCVDVLAFGRAAPSRAVPQTYDIDGLVQAVRLLSTALDIAHDVQRDAATQTSHNTRSIAVSPANLAALLMSRGFAYASDEGRALAATISALVTATAAATSAGLAEKLGACASFPARQDKVLGDFDVMQRLLLGQPVAHADTGRACLPAPLFPYTDEQARLLDAARSILARAIKRTHKTGLRNATLSSAADDPQMGRILTADSTGLKPVRTLVHYRCLTPDLDPQAIYKLVSPSVPAALRALHHEDAAIDRMLDYIVGTGSLQGAPGVNYDLLRERGFCDEDMEITESALATASNIRSVFTPYVLGWDDAVIGGTDVLARLGFSEWDVEHANFHCCGALTLEGARELPLEHLPVFDCDEPLGQIGTRCVGVQDRLLMAHAVQPFVTAGIELDLSLPASMTLSQIEALYCEADRLGLHAVRLNRAATSLSEPMGYDDLFEGDFTPNTDAQQHLATRALEDNIQVRSIETDMPVSSHDMHNSAAADALVAAISVGLKHGVPVDAYQEALAALGGSAGTDGLADTLQAIATSFLAGGSDRMPPRYDPLNQPGARIGADANYANEPMIVRAPDTGIHTDHEIGARRTDDAPCPSPTFGDPALSPPSVSGRSREE